MFLFKPAYLNPVFAEYRSDAFGYRHDWTSVWPFITLGKLHGRQIFP